MASIAEVKTATHTITSAKRHASSGFSYSSVTECGVVPETLTVAVEVAYPLSDAVRSYAPP
jgi:hypothetical protein